MSVLHVDGRFPRSANCAGEPQGATRGPGSSVVHMRDTWEEAGAGIFTGRSRSPPSLASPTQFDKIRMAGMSLFLLIGRTIVHVHFSNTGPFNDSQTQTSHWILVSLEFPRIICCNVLLFSASSTTPTTHGKGGFINIIIAPVLPRPLNPPHRRRPSLSLCHPRSS